MEPTQELIDEIYRERVMRAREMSPSDRVREGLALFDRTCCVMADGIRHQFPDADEQRVGEILRQRLDLARRLDAPSGEG